MSSADASVPEAPQPRQSWQAGRFCIDLGQPRVMGIVNVTPDSFSDGGAHLDASAALAHCERLLEEGADILDIGGESSRPGAARLPLEEELRRVVPVLKFAVGLGAPVSIDTYKPEVMAAALELGADIVNDIHALQRPGALQAVAADAGCGVCLMHMQGDPVSMQHAPGYTDVVHEVRSFLAGRLADARAAGIAAERIVLDPGIGFGKSVAHNFALLSGQQALADLGRPILAGWSRKSSLGAVTGRPVEQRQAASVSAALAAIHFGAAIVRVHDVAQTVDAIKVWQAAGLIQERATTLGKKRT
ncbi:MAG: dihydropteroate synthase [Aquabacterium sp.]|jgi:dihydropteroate synthase|nr:MAG: dihydropteroate synthase [Aquabacterium sp.]